MRNKPLPGLQKLPCGCIGACKCPSAPLKYSGVDLAEKRAELYKQEAMNPLKHGPYMNPSDPSAPHGHEALPDAFKGKKKKKKK